MSSQPSPDMLSCFFQYLQVTKNSIKLSVIVVNRLISLKLTLLSIDMDIQVIIEPLIQSLKLNQSLDKGNRSNG